MSILSNRTVITLACVMAVNATPSLDGVVTPTDKTAVSTAPAHYRYGHHRPAGWGWHQRRVRLRRGTT